MFKNRLSWKIMYATAHWLGLKPILLSNLWASKHLNIHTCRSGKSTFSCPPNPLEIFIFGTSVFIKTCVRPCLEQLDWLLMHLTERIIVNYTLFWIGHHWKLTGIFVFIKFCWVYYLNIFISCWILILIHIQLDHRIIFPWLFLERKLLMVVPLLNVLPQMIQYASKSYWN